jgi:hypothetical protein
MSVQPIRARLGKRWKLALAAALATATPFAEGVFKSGWIEVVLLAPIVWYLLAPRTPAVLPNLLVSLLSLCLAVSAMDLALRPLIGQRLHYTPSNIVSHKLPRLPILGRWDANVDLDMASYGDLAALSGEAGYREPRRIAFLTDAFGFRNLSTEGPVDVLVLGDSFGAGMGTTDDKIFARLIETRYGRRTYNLSYPGGPYDQMINFMIESPRLTFAPHAVVVWILYTGNDLDDSGGETWEYTELPWRGVLGEWQVRYRTFRNRSPLNQWMEAVRWRVQGQSGGVIVRDLPDGRPLLFQDRHEAWGTRARVEVETHPNFVKLERTLVTMKGLVEKRSLGLILMIFPTKGEVYRWVLEQRGPRPDDERPSGFSDAVLAACGRLALRCVDAKPGLIKEARQLYDETGDLLWWRDDTHLGEKGHEAVAAFIAQFVQNSGR